MKRTLLVASLVLSSLVFVRADVFQIDFSGGLMTGTQEVPPNASTAQGGEVGDGISYDNSTQTLTINAAYGMFGFNPLQGTFTASHIHIGAAGVSGPVEIALSPTQVTANSGFFQQSVVLNAAEEADLFANTLYMNIHSDVFPGGEIRAQLIPTSVPEPATWALAGLGIAALVVFRRRR